MKELFKKEFKKDSECIFVNKAITDKKTGITFAHIVDDDCNEFIYVGFEQFFSTGYYSTDRFLNGSLQEYDFESWSKIVDRYACIDDYYGIVLVNVTIFH